MEKILRKVFVASSVEKAKGEDSFLFVASDESVDRYGDIVRVDGWQLENFARNPIVLFSHDPQQILGTAKVSKSGKQLLAKITFASTPAAQEKRALVEQNVLRGISVGFVSKEFEPRTEGGWTFTSQELLELSLVAIPANSNALIQRLFTDRDSLLRSALRKLVSRVQ